MLLALVASWIVLAQANPPPAPKADPLLAQQLLAAGRTRDAEAMYEQLVQLAPSDGSLWNALGGGRFAQKDYLDAIPAFRRAHELLPSNLTVLDNLGCSYFNAQQLDAARETFQKSVEVAPSAPRSHTFLGRIAALPGDASTAESEFQLAVGSPQVDSLAPFHYGLHLFQERRLEDAARAFEYALRLDPEFASAHMNLGLVLQRRGDMARAPTARLQHGEADPGAHRRLSLQEIRQPHAIERVVDALLQHQPDGTDAAILRLGAALLGDGMGDAMDVERPALGRRDHFAHGDVHGVVGEDVAALGAARAADDTRATESQ